MMHVTQSRSLTDIDLHLRRWVSFWYQINAITKTNATKVLEIGAGPKIVSTFTREQIGLDVITFDIDKNLGPDIVGDVRKLEDYFTPNLFDCVCAFEVLEHMPYEDLVECLRQMAKVSRKHVVISLPYWGYMIQVRFLFHKTSFAFGRKITRPFIWRYDGSHYWEIGTRGYSLKRIIQDIEKYLIIKCRYFCPDNPYHYFFECEKKRSSEL